MRFFPVFLDLSVGTVVLAGGGEAAANKLRLLRAAGARVRWYVDDAGRGIGIDPDERLDVVAADASPVDLSDVVAVVAATGTGWAAGIAAQARAQRIPVNVVDRPDLSTFIVPAIVDRGDVVVAIGTGGAAPVLARRLRERIEALLPARIGALAALMGRYRERLGAVLSKTVARRRFWENVVDGPIAAALLSGRSLEAEAELVRAIDAAGRAPASPGTVFMVGTGPGDADLLTLKALHALQSADVVLHDEQVTPEILERARRDAVRVFAGRRAGGPGIGQDGINRLMLQAARSGQTVVRLTGGDPSGLGGGAELAVLRAAGVRVVIVPGVAPLRRAVEAAMPLEEAA
jgi:uroporphyrin-III C-methyltransferase/precorrin-2 dehydrogenase/sirohydrochlorin ferrochelatase